MAASNPTLQAHWNDKAPTPETLNPKNPKPYIPLKAGLKPKRDPKGAVPGCAAARLQLESALLRTLRRVAVASKKLFRAEGVSRFTG